jgi:signal transduction histidine kinase
METSIEQAALWRTDATPGMAPAPAGGPREDLRALLAPAPIRWAEQASTEFDIEPVVEAALRQCAPSLARAILARHLRPARARGCPERIVRVLVHLLRNAAQATAGLARPAIVRIDAQADGGRLRLRVTDNGCGIDPALLARWVEGAPGGGATGLGLALCQAIVQAHGGTLRAGNRRPHGARFEFDLPLAPVAGALAGAATEPRP